VSQSIPAQEEGWCFGELGLCAQKAIGRLQNRRSAECHFELEVELFKAEWLVLAEPVFVGGLL
jgi:hypothetical protein